MVVIWVQKRARKTMNSFKQIIFLLILYFLTSASIVKSKNTSIEANTICSAENLSLNGSGVRKKLFIKHYTAALYVMDKSNSAEKLLSLSQPPCLRFHITSSKITSKKIIKATQEGFKKSTQENTRPIKDEIEKFLPWLDQPIKKGDMFEFSYTSDSQIEISKNNLKLGQLKNNAFSSALFGIWLGQNPVQIGFMHSLFGK